MALENLNPLDELKRLDQQVDSATELAGLKPIFFRLDEIAKQNANDFEVQLAVGDIKQHLVNRGSKLKAMKEAPPAAGAPPMPPPMPSQGPQAAAPPPMPPPVSTVIPPTGPPKVRIPPPAPSGSSIANAPPDANETVYIVPSGKPPARPEASEPTVMLTSQALPMAEPLATTERSSPVVAPPAVPPPPPGLPQTASKPKPPSRVPPKPPLNWKRSLWLGGVAGALIAAVGIVALVKVARKPSKKGGAAEVQVAIATNPPGASVRINGDVKCTSNCSVSLAPGTYQITAFLDGYEPAASGVVVAPGQPASVNLPLEPQAPSLRILTDLDSGKVAIDDQPPVDLQDGQFILDSVPAGTHTIRLTGKNGEGSFTFSAAPAQIPTMTTPVTVKNLNATVVTSLGNQAHVVTDSGPLKLVVNGQPEADAAPAGVDLKNFQGGVDELVLGEGKDQRNVKESFGPAPMLTAFFKSDLDIGTLIVSTGEDDVRVFVNDREWPRKTKRGQVRIPTIGKKTVRVAKDGFEPAAAQVAEVKKGGETRLEFKLQPMPKFATLTVNGGTPGAQVIVDQRNLGVIGADGSFTNPGIAPGDHTIELRHDQFVPRRFSKTFKAGVTVTISGADATLEAEKVAPPPEQPKQVAVVPPRERPAPAPVRLGTMDDWENNSLWRREGGEYIHQGNALILYKLPPKGVFTFTAHILKGGGLFKSAKLRWVLNYVDNKNYSYYELDDKNFTPRVVINGKTSERDKTPLKDMDKQKAFTIQIEVTPEHIVHKLFVDGQWVNLDVWAEPGRNFSEGKFGFQVQGNDEIGITDFKFQPK